MLKNHKGLNRNAAIFDRDLVEATGSSWSERIQQHLEVIYAGVDAVPPQRLPALVDQILDVCRAHVDEGEASLGEDRWDQTDVALICYGDQVSEASGPTLDTLREFLIEHGVEQLLNIVHLLPINPYTSDDGFSVVDYRQVDPRLGDWEQVAQLEQSFDLMLDLVLNHVSQQSEYFQRFLRAESPYERFFIVADPAEDYSAVTRPRKLSLLTEKEATTGPLHVWTTFSEDQIDLNFSEPQVLLEMLDVMLSYTRLGGRIIRLDAIAYLWKKLGTDCIHLPQTHEVVKLMRTCLEAIGSRSLLLTETNVPHDENTRYFGQSDEAHLVYQFSLPPLLLDGLLHEDASTLGDWIQDVSETAEDNNYFNFTASHDGIGVRPLEGLVSEERVQALVDRALACGGDVGTKSNPDGTTSPYELNVTYLDMLLLDPDSPTPDPARFLASQAVMLTLRGIPGIYFHSLFGTRNDHEGVRISGIPRRINRKKFLRHELDQKLTQPDSLTVRIFEVYQQLLKIRRQQPAFHPNARQRVVPLSDPALLAFQRVCDRSGQRISVVTNFGSQPRTLRSTDLPGPPLQSNLLTGVTPGSELELPPYGYLWLEHQRDST